MPRLAIKLLMMVFVLLIACKDTAPSMKPTNGSTNPPTDTPPGGTFPDPSGTSPSPPGADVSDLLKLRASAIHQSVVGALRAKFPEVEGSLWFESKFAVDDDFIAASPLNLWGLDADQLPPKVVDCEVGKTAGCDADFRRMACQTQSDCTLSGTTCEPLSATVFILNHPPKKLCITAADHLLDRFYNVMVSAEKELDITSLSMPEDRFATMLYHALSILSQKPSRPTVRMLLSGKTILSINLFNPPQKEIDDLMVNVRKISPSPENLRIKLAWLSKGTSWNHSKIVVADGDRALSGGHNMWDHDYLRTAPISDLSLEYRGEAAEKTRDFADALWALVDKDIGVSTPNAADISHTMKATTAATAPMIQVGRLGTYGVDPADEAINAMIDAATTTLQIDQQDFFNTIAAKNFSLPAFDHIVKAAVRGVKVTLIQSNKYPLGNYGMVDPKVSYGVFHKELVKQLMEAKGLTQVEASAKACETLAYLPFRINAKFVQWPNGEGVYGSHTKLIMADEAVVYVGSQNLYLADLQEFGNIITDAGTTTKLKQQYWDRLFKESSPAKLPCPG